MGPSPEQPAAPYHLSPDVGLNCTWPQEGASVCGRGVEETASLKPPGRSSSMQGESCSDSECWGRSSHTPVFCRAAQKAHWSPGVNVSGTVPQFVSGTLGGGVDVVYVPFLEGILATSILNIFNNLQFCSLKK